LPAPVRGSLVVEGVEGGRATRGQKTQARLLPVGQVFVLSVGVPLRQSLRGGAGYGGAAPIIPVLHLPGLRPQPVRLHEVPSLLRHLPGSAQRSYRGWGGVIPIIAGLHLLGLRPQLVRLHGVPSLLRQRLSSAQPVYRGWGGVFPITAGPHLLGLRPQLVRLHEVPSLLRHLPDSAPLVYRGWGGAVPIIAGPHLPGLRPQPVRLHEVPSLLRHLPGSAHIRKALSSRHPPNNFCSASDAREVHKLHSFLRSKLAPTSKDLMFPQSSSQQLPLP
ncbi:hypothetical protein B484DRAFT_35098, partial [Ochromonadaceae sp. CCMP2298]